MIWSHEVRIDRVQAHIQKHLWSLARKGDDCSSLRTTWSSMDYMGTSSRHCRDRSTWQTQMDRCLTPRRARIAKLASSWVHCSQCGTSGQVAPQVARRRRGRIIDKKDEQNCSRHRPAAAFAHNASKLSFKGWWMDSARAGHCEI